MDRSSANWYITSSAHWRDANKPHQFLAAQCELTISRNSLILFFQGQLLEVCIPNHFWPFLVLICYADEFYDTL